ncbi:hypothetical protein GWK47_055040 [Chionoecetes opilio]|uniref:Uncharacterized protein n=1 Tax=Chionoecetes opilio TaxID=41210 RepID=A0A8J4Y6I0_CHIOP|nr:hypothetical protein GWK47_055040 [Chionoecetes opilio]
MEMKPTSQTGNWTMSSESYSRWLYIYSCCALSQPSCPDRAPAQASAVRGRTSEARHRSSIAPRREAIPRTSSAVASETTSTAAQPPQTRNSSKNSLKIADYCGRGGGHHPDPDRAGVVCCCCCPFCLLYKWRNRGTIHNPNPEVMQPLQTQPLAHAPPQHCHHAPYPTQPGYPTPTQPMYPPQAGYPPQPYPPSPTQLNSHSCTQRSNPLRTTQRIKCGSRDRNRPM